MLTAAVLFHLSRIMSLNYDKITEADKGKSKNICEILKIIVETFVKSKKLNNSKTVC